jgi:hypothetical protein
METRWRRTLLAVFVFWVLAALGGFSVGLPELAVLGVLLAVVLWWIWHPASSRVR